MSTFVTIVCICSIIIFFGGVGSFLGSMLLLIVTPIVTPTLANHIFAKRQLNEEKNISQIGNSVELKQKYTNTDVSRIDSIDIKKIVSNFSNTMEEKFETDELINFHNNINQIDIILKSEKELKASGAYNEVENEIYYSDISALNHELFHMSSSTHNKENNLYYCGFTQSDYKKWTIGCGINEGYTELITARYFGNDNNNGYEYETFIAKCLEKIVGQKEMERLYLTANLMGLIENLKQYSTEEDILKFIGSLDYLHTEFSLIYGGIIKNNDIEPCLENIFGFLLKSYTLKLENELKSGTITKNEYLIQIKKYMNLINIKHVKLGIHQYSLRSEDTICKLNNYINNLNNDDLCVSLKKL